MYPNILLSHKMEYLKVNEDMFTEENRLKTFTSWPIKTNKKCNAKRMAEAGFYFIGDENHPDAAKCFCCQKELSDWEPNDDPWKEHKKHSCDCQFILMGKIESEHAVRESLVVSHSAFKNFLQKDTDKKIEFIRKKMEEAKNDILKTYNE